MEDESSFVVVENEKVHNVRQFSFLELLAESSHVDSESSKVYITKNGVRNLTVSEIHDNSLADYIETIDNPDANHKVKEESSSLKENIDLSRPS